ncbi:MAG: 3-dehydroquinate synthase [bacterium]
MNKLVKLKIPSSTSHYDIIITDEPPFLTLTRRINRMNYSSLTIITNVVVWKLYGSLIDSTFREQKLAYRVIVLSDGEKYKNLETVQTIYKRLLAYRMDRSSVIIGIGGGVVGDITGFVASTYMRGIRFIQVPTTLLAQVDAAIGGKTGVDYAFIKNVVGTFYQPVFIYSNVNLLQTLQDRVYRSGLAEVIKYGVVKDKDLFSYIEKNIEGILKQSKRVMLNIVYSSSNAKAWFVQKDEKEITGIRTLLNFGHTFGHAIETVSNYKILHGEAVGMGMVIAAKLSKRLNLCKEDVVEKLEDLVQAIGLTKYRNTFDINDLSKAINYDKKSRATKINLVLVKKIGVPVIYTMDKKMLKKILMEVKYEG